MPHPTSLCHISRKMKLKIYMVRKCHKTTLIINGSSAEYGVPIPLLDEKTHKIAQINT